MTIQLKTQRHEAAEFLFISSATSCLHVYLSRSTDIYQNNRLLFHVIQKDSLIFCLSKINLFQVDATDSTVVHRPEINLPVTKIGSRSPLCGTWNISMHFSFRVNRPPFRREYKIVAIIFQNIWIIGRNVWIYSTKYPVSST